jgi:hypothetical protein
MAKYIRVRFPDGDWGIPAEVVAKDFAKFYADTDNDTSYEAELAFALSEDGERALLDWAAGNMNWEDVKAHAVHVRPLAIDYENEWVNTKKSVVEVPDGHSGDRG